MPVILSCLSIARGLLCICMASGVNINGPLNNEYCDSLHLTPQSQRWTIFKHRSHYPLTESRLIYPFCGLINPPEEVLNTSEKMQPPKMEGRHINACSWWSLWCPERSGRHTVARRHPLQSSPVRQIRLRTDEQNPFKATPSCRSRGFCPRQGLRQIRDRMRSATSRKTSNIYR